MTVPFSPFEAFDLRVSTEVPFLGHFREKFRLLGARGAYGAFEVQTLPMGAVLLSYGVLVLHMTPWHGSHTRHRQLCYRMPAVRQVCR